MKALVSRGPGDKAWEEVPDPEILQPIDALVRIETTTICGTDRTHSQRGRAGSDRWPHIRPRASATSPKWDPRSTTWRSVIA